MPKLKYSREKTKSGRFRAVISFYVNKVNHTYGTLYNVEETKHSEAKGKLMVLVEEKMELING